MVGVSLIKLSTLFPRHLQTFALIRKAGTIDKRVKQVSTVTHLSTRTRRHLDLLSRLHNLYITNVVGLLDIVRGHAVLTSNGSHGFLSFHRMNLQSCGGLQLVEHRFGDKL